MVKIMYGYIKGIVKQINADYIIIETNQIGYQIISPQPYSYQLEEQTIVYTYLHVREDILALYGFNSDETLRLFKKLLSVSGIGPKSALSLVAGDKTQDVVAAIEKNDVKFLTKFPGIGTKSAQQIILDLKGKLVIDETELIPSITSDVSAALSALGYKSADITKALKQINLETTVEVAIKEALQWMIRN